MKGLSIFLGGKMPLHSLHSMDELRWSTFNKTAAAVMEPYKYYLHFPDFFREGGGGMVPPNSAKLFWQSDFLLKWEGVAPKYGN